MKPTKDASGFRADITVRDLTTRSLEPKDYEQCRKRLLSLIEEAVSANTETVHINLTDWIAFQFATATNNELLHGLLIKESGFFDFFLGLKDQDQITFFLAQQLTKRDESKGYLTTLSYKGNNKGVSLIINFSILEETMKKAHAAANQKITRGREMPAWTPKSKIQTTLLKSFVKAL